MGRRAEVSLVVMGKDASKRATSSVRAGLLGIKKAVFSLRGAFVSLGVAMVGKSFFKAGATAEGYRLRLEALTGSQEEANKAFEMGSKFAGRVPFEYEKIMGSVTALMGIMEGGTEEIQRWLPMIADLAAVSGLSIEETTGQIIRMYSAGAASADMFRERGILQMLGFQAGATYSAEQTKDQIVAAWGDIESKFRGAADKLGTSWDGLMSMLGDRWFQFRTKVTDAGLFDVAKSSLQEFLDMLETMEEEGKLEEWAQKVSDTATDAISGVRRYGGLVWTVLKAIMTTLVNTAGIAFQVGKGIGHALEVVFFGILRSITWLANQAIGVVNLVIRGANLIPGVDIGEVSKLNEDGLNRLQLTAAANFEAAGGKILDMLGEIGNGWLDVADAAGKAAGAQDDAVKPRVVKPPTPPPEPKRPTMGPAEAAGEDPWLPPDQAIPFWFQLASAMAAADDGLDSMSNLMSDMTHNLLQDFGSAFEDAFYKIAQGSGHAGRAFEAAFKNAIASVASYMGQFYMGKAIGSIGEAFLGHPGAAAAAAKYFAAATLMFALSGTLKGRAARLGGAGGSGASRAAQDSDQLADQKGEATVYIQGGLLDMTDPRQVEQFMRMLEAVQGRRVNIVTLPG